MKKRILVVAISGLAATLIGCSSTSLDSNSGQGIAPGSTATTPISEQRLAVSEFKQQGVKVIYNLWGNLEAIEVTGYAAVWGGSTNAARESYRVAELEAKKSLNDFINKESIQSSVSVKMISQNLEHARDNNTNKFSNNKANGSDELVAVDDDTAKQSAGPSETTENLAVRNNALKIASTLSTTITNSNRGILGGLYLKEGAVIDDGKAVRVVMRWDKKSNATRPELRKLMAM